MIPAATRERHRPLLLLSLVARPLKTELPSASTDDVEGISLLGSSDHSWNTDSAPVSACPCSLRSDNIDIRFLLLLFRPPVSSFQTHSGPGALIASSAAFLSPPMSAEGSNESAPACLQPARSSWPTEVLFACSCGAAVKPGPSLFPWSCTMVARRCRHDPGQRCPLSSSCPPRCLQISFSGQLLSPFRSLSNSCCPQLRLHSWVVIVVSRNLLGSI